MKRKESALRLGFTFAGCYLGAGYVSGQELWQFFGCFGWQGIAGLLLAVALSFFFGVLLLRLVQRTGCDQTDALVIRRPIPLLRDAVGLLQLFFLFGILVIMAARGGGAFRADTGCLRLLVQCGVLPFDFAAFPYRHLRHGKCLFHRGAAAGYLLGAGQRAYPAPLRLAAYHCCSPIRQPTAFPLGYCRLLFCQL